MSKDLPIVEDIYGKALKDYYRAPKNQKLIVHSDIAETDIYPLSWFFRAQNQFPELEQIALSQCTGKILDIGAGTGIHAYALQQQNKDCTAIDISPGAVEIMQQRGIQNVKFQDFFTITNTHYDTLLMLMNGFGIMGKIENISTFFAKADELLSPKGQILADSSDLIHLYQEDDGSVQLNLNSAYYGEIVYQMEFNNELGIPFPWVFIDFNLLHSEALKAGFKAVKIFEESDGHYLAKITRM